MVEHAVLLNDEDVKIINRILSNKVYTSQVVAYLINGKHNWEVSNSDVYFIIRTKIGMEIRFHYNFFAGIKFRMDLLDVYRVAGDNNTQL